MPVVASAELGSTSTGYGILLGCLGVGSVIGAAILAPLRQRYSADVLAAAGIVAFALATAALALLHQFTLVALAMLVGGAMLERKQGRVINIASIRGYSPNPGRISYCAPKAAVIMMTHVAAGEWGPHGVRINAIAPGLVRTDFARALWENPALYRKRTKDTPLQRIGEPDEIAGAAVFLASAAGSFTTGQTIVIDGGTTAGSVVSHDD